MHEGDTLISDVPSAIERIFCVGKRFASSKLISGRFAQQVEHEAVISDVKEDFFCEMIFKNGVVEKGKMMLC